MPWSTPARRPPVSALAVVALAALAVAGCQKRPADCELAPALATLDKAATGGLAKKAVAEADALANRALDDANAQDSRPGFLRRYDGALCLKAKAKLADAQRAVERADKAKAPVEASFKEARASLDDALKHVEAGIEWLDAMPPPPGAGPKDAAGPRDLVGESRALQQAVKNDEDRIERAAHDAELAGWDVPPEIAMALSRDADRRLPVAKDIEKNAKKAALDRCHEKRTDVTGIRLAEPFVVMTAPNATLVFRKDTDGKCHPVHVEKRALDVGTLRVWKIVRPRVEPVLVGWTPKRAWFVTVDGGFASFAHTARTPCKAGGTCDAPKLGESVEATCTCGDGSRFTARYAWDGHAPFPEP